MRVDGCSQGFIVYKAVYDGIINMRRQRLTITLDPRTLRRLDAFIDGRRIRNRSHAIESIIKESLPPTVNKAVILAGGRGVHFRPITYEIPSVLIPFRGKPLLEHLLSQVKQIGILDVVICVGHLADRIIEQFGDGSGLGVKITYSHDGDKPLGTAGAIWNARKYIRGGPFLVMHGDVLSDIDLADMIDFHSGEGSVATLALTTADDPRQYGMVRVKGTSVVEFSEKPRSDTWKSNLIHAGVYILEDRVFESFSDQVPSMIEKEVFPKLAQRGKVSAYIFEKQWFDISYPEDYEAALKSFRVNHN